MDKKDDILAMSRNENKNKDLVDIEADIKARNIAAASAAILCAVFLVIQLFVGGGLNHGLVALIFSLNAITYIVKSIRMKRRNDITFAVIHTVVTVIFSFQHIQGLITSSPNL
jgi:Flp pilus assembly protein TadB